MTAQWADDQPGHRQAKGALTPETLSRYTPGISNISKISNITVTPFDLEKKATDCKPLYSARLRLLELSIPQKKKISHALNI